MVDRSKVAPGQCSDEVPGSAVWVVGAGKGFAKYFEFKNHYTQPNARTPAHMLVFCITI
jgi:hypothetical protein